MAIQLITDSTCYIPEDLLQQHQIMVVPLSVNFEEDSFLDMPADFSAFYKKLEEVDYIPKSAQPPIALMQDAFETGVKSGDSVIGIFLSSKMSGTYSTACMIREQLLEAYPDAQITVIDSSSNSMQMGLSVLAGARAISEGKSYEEVVATLETTIPKTKFVFSPATLEYLKRGGRIGGASAFLGHILQVKPILTVQDGAVISIDKVRTRKKAIQYIADTFMKDVHAYGLANVVIHHIEDMEEALKLKVLIEEQLNIQDVKIIDIGPVIGTHVGPGAIGIAYETTKEMTV